MEKQGLDYEENVDLTVKLIDNATDEMVGTASVYGKILKCIAVEQNRRGEGISALLLTILIRIQFERMQFHLFVFYNVIQDHARTSGTVQMYSEPGRNQWLRQPGLRPL